MQNIFTISQCCFIYGFNLRANFLSYFFDPSILS